ncbi:NADH-ubiquinone oxidoreductase 19.3 kda subunit [Physcia stellaris]|nr:NADH-ubiquinone oxidoreductase 19.3 kda subunit [Physcia stellaris]
MSSMFLRCLALLVTGLLILHSAEATIFHPKRVEARDGSLLQQRQSRCEGATLDVNQNRIIEDASPTPNTKQGHLYLTIDCPYVSAQLPELQRLFGNQQVQRNGLRRHAGRLPGLQELHVRPPKFADLTKDKHNTNPTPPKSLQAYAYCGCIYTLPNDLYDCARVQIGARPFAPATVIDPNSVPSPTPSARNAASFSSSRVAPTPSGLAVSAAARLTVTLTVTSISRVTAPCTSISRATTTVTSISRVTATVTSTSRVTSTVTSISRVTPTPNAVALSVGARLTVTLTVTSFSRVTATVRNCTSSTRA